MSALTTELDGIAAGGASTADFPELLAGAHARMGADRVEIGRNDVIGAFRQSDDIACLAPWRRRACRADCGSAARRWRVTASTRRSARRRACPRSEARPPRGSAVRSEPPRRASRVWPCWRARRRHERHSLRPGWSGSAGRGRIRRSGDASRPDRTCAPNTRQRKPPVSGAPLPLRTAERLSVAWADSLVGVCALADATNAISATRAARIRQVAVNTASRCKKIDAKVHRLRGS